MKFDAVRPSFLSSDRFFQCKLICFSFCPQKGAVTKVVTVVKTKKGPHTHKKKGELMENDQDAMEVSHCFTTSCHLCWRNVYSIVVSKY